MPNLHGCGALDDRSINLAMISCGHYGYMSARFGKERETTARFSICPLAWHLQAIKPELNTLQDIACYGQNDLLTLTDSLARPVVPMTG